MAGSQNLVLLSTPVLGYKTYTHTEITQNLTIL